MSGSDCRTIRFRFKFGRFRPIRTAEPQAQEVLPKCDQSCVLGPAIPRQERKPKETSLGSGDVLQPPPRGSSVAPVGGKVW